MKRGYQESPSTSLGPPQSRARHDPQGKYFSVLALAHLFFHRCEGFVDPGLIVFDTVGWLNFQVEEWG